MINFLNEDVRQRFHELPIDRQMELQKFARDVKPLTILFVMLNEDGTSEISIRIDEKINHSIRS